MTDRELVARIAALTGQKTGYKDLARDLELSSGRARRLLLEQLARLTEHGLLTKVDREHWGIPQRTGTRENLMAGGSICTATATGLCAPTRGRARVWWKTFLFPPTRSTAPCRATRCWWRSSRPRPTDAAWAALRASSSGATPTVVGTFHYARSKRAPGNWVVPFDDRMTQNILIPVGKELPEVDEVATPHRVLGTGAATAAEHDDLEGLIVDVEITSWPTPTREPIGKVIEVLGDPDDFGVDVEMMIRKHQFAADLPGKGAGGSAQRGPPGSGRSRQAQRLPRSAIVTIDGETARDFDDAVLVTERAHGAGYELQVHIADVSEYVQAGTDLDLEARLRGTSVYFPDRAIPMLPQELSTDICSLRPGEDRLVLSCVMQLDAAGRIESYEIAKGVIRSAARMTYNEVHAILEGDAEVRARYAALTPAFERMKKLAELMNKRREERGSIDFDLPEPVIEFDEQGQMRGVTKSERTWANRLIEEFMLAANECVATWLEDLGVPSIYRIHEKPEPRRVVQFEELAAAFGYTLGLGALPVKRIQTRGDRRDSYGTGRKAREIEVPEDIPVTPRMYQKLAKRIEGKPEERI